MGLTSKEHTAFRNIRTRVLQLAPSAKKSWGGTAYEGMDLQPEWRTADGFQDFINHVGLAPGPEYLIDRIENSKGYVKGNVKWSTPKESAANRNNKAKSFTINGETKTLSEWAKPLGISVSTLSVRLSSGRFTPEEAVSIPKNGRYVFKED